MPRIASSSRETVLGVMQPYFFPYVGYFQYMMACSHFILYDDVQFIMRGWINRNNILLNGKAHMLTVPLVKASPNRTIAKTMVMDGPWPARMMATLEQAYRKAPYWQGISSMVQGIFGAGHATIASLASASIQAVCAYLDLPVTVVPTSTAYNNSHLARNERLYDLCDRMNARVCIVPQGGRALYAKPEFALHGIELRYLVPDLSPYDQSGTAAFVPSLSILDVLAWNGPAGTRAMLEKYTLA
jgi:hypothetical protein